MELIIDKISKSSTEDYAVKVDRASNSTLLRILGNTLSKCKVNYRLYSCDDFNLPHYCFEERMIDLRLWNNSKYCNVVYRSIERLCSKCDKYAIIPVGLSSCVDVGHMIVFIYIKSENKFYLFDSSGSRTRYKHLADTLVFFFGYYKVIKDCEKIQLLESEAPNLPGEIGGYCCPWSCFFIYCHSKLNKEVKMVDIINKILVHCDTPIKLRKLVRNFSYLAFNNRLM